MISLVYMIFLRRMIEAMEDNYQSEIEYYKNKEIYFRNIGFFNLAEDFHRIVILLEKLVNKGEE